MQYIGRYTSPLGEILLACDETGLTGAWFEGQKHVGSGLGPEWTENSFPRLAEAGRWLDRYFAGREPDFMPPLHPVGTPFQCAVWELLREIPYGTVTTYGEIARRLALRNGAARISARAVGGAIGRNRLSLFIPCHRVVGAGGSLTGYAGGVSRKAALLRLEAGSLPLLRS